MALLLPEQCRAARALLDWQQRDLAQQSKVSRKSIADFERGRTMPWARTLDDIREAFEAAGIEFLDDVQDVGGVGVRMKAGFKPVTRGTEEDSKDGESDNALKAEPIEKDPKLVAYWAERPELWASFSATGRHALSIEMFGDPYAADEAFGIEGR
jgi:transcriptional regulator with XRE-family HTH domain